MYVQNESSNISSFQINCVKGTASLSVGGKQRKKKYLFGHALPYPGQNNGFPPKTFLV
jgi:hypothetical protein